MTISAVATSLDSCGLKAVRVGGVVSEKHANVFATGLPLEPELQLVGFAGTSEEAG